MNQVFNVMVIGENPNEQMEKYNASKKITKYIKYKIDDAAFLKNKALITVKAMINEMKDLPHAVDYLENHLADIEEMTDVQYFSLLTTNLEHDEEGNAWDDQNPIGKWGIYNTPLTNTIPLPKHNGEEVFQAMKNEIDWNKIHLANQELYKRTWEIIIDGDKPINDVEKTIYSSMKDKEEYVKAYKTKENYVIFNTAYWNYAVIKNGEWIDAENKNINKWVSEFYDTFIKDIPNDELITLYEYQIIDDVIRK
jgi:hypothetical protein